MLHLGAKSLQLNFWIIINLAGLLQSWAEPFNDFS